MRDDPSGGRFSCREVVRKGCAEWSALAALRLHGSLQRRQPRHAHQVVRRRYEVTRQLGPLQSAVPRPAEATYVSVPALVVLMLRRGSFCYKPDVYLYYALMMVLPLGVESRTWTSS